MEDAAVPAAATNRVAESTAAVVSGVSSRSSRSPRVSRSDLLSQIEASRNRQAAGIAEALGSVLGDILNPPRTLRDISNDYEHASRNLRTAIGPEIEFWNTARASLMEEMQNSTNNNNI